MRTYAHFVRDRRASSAVEFAILAPVFLLLLTGMLAYGIYFGASHALQQLAADAARTAVAGLNEAERNRLVADYIARNAEEYGLIDRERLSYSIGDSGLDPNQYRVTLVYDARDLPIWNLYPPLPMPGQRLTHSSTIRRGGI